MNTEPSTSSSSDVSGSDGRRRIRVFVQDDHEVERAGVRDTLEDYGEFVVGDEAGTAAKAMHRIPATMPDVYALDIRLPDGNGVEVCRDIRSTTPTLGCLMLVSFSDDEAPRY